MTALPSKPSKKIAAEPDERRRVANLKRWLRREKGVNLAIEMYTDEGIDQSKRHEKGHSSSFYYPRRDEDDTLELVKAGICSRYKTFIDLGVGGEKAVDRALDLARGMGADGYIGCDLAQTLLDGAARRAQQQAFRTVTYNCDIFRPLPFVADRSLMGILGLTIQNLETFENPEDLRECVVDLFKNYAKALTSSDPTLTATNGFLIGWDANMNAEELKNCYFNEEFGELVCSLVGSAISMDKFKYDVIIRKVPLRGEEVMYHVSTGVRAIEDHIVFYDGDRFPVKKDKFLPILDSTRFNVPMMLNMMKDAGLNPQDNQRWSATGRIHYQHVPIAVLQH